MTHSGTNWARPGDGVSISIDVVFYTDVTRQHAHIHALNRMLREFGIPPRVPGESALIDGLKSPFANAIAWDTRRRGFKRRGFWIATSLGQGMRRIVDIGGSVGIKYFAFGKFIDYPPDIVRRAIDVPAVAARGKAFAAANGAAQSLQFSDMLPDADEMDLFFFSGALQYLPESLPEMLDRLSRRPARIVIDTTPIHRTIPFSP